MGVDRPIAALAAVLTIKINLLIGDLERNGSQNPVTIIWSSCIPKPQAAVYKRNQSLHESHSSKTIELTIQISFFISLLLLYCKQPQKHERSKSQI